MASKYSEEDLAIFREAQRSTRSYRTQEIGDAEWLDSNLEDHLVAPVIAKDGGILLHLCVKFWKQLLGETRPNQFPAIVITLACHISETPGGDKFLTDSHTKRTAPSAVRNPLKLKACDSMTIADFRAIKWQQGTIATKDSDVPKISEDANPDDYQLMDDDDIGDDLSEEEGATESVPEAFEQWFRNIEVDEIIVVSCYAALICARTMVKPPSNVRNFLTNRFYQGCIKFFGLESPGVKLPTPSLAALTALKEALSVPTPISNILLSRALLHRKYCKTISRGRDKGDQILSQALLLHLMGNGNKLLLVLHHASSRPGWGIGKVISRVLNSHTGDSVLDVMKFLSVYDPLERLATNPRSLWMWARCLDDGYISSFRPKDHPELYAHIVAINERNPSEGLWRGEVLKGFDKTRQASIIRDQNDFDAWAEATADTDMILSTDRQQMLKWKEEKALEAARREEVYLRSDSETD